MKIEDSKIKYLSWNEFNSDNSCFESKQCFSVLLPFPFRGILKKTGHKSLLCSKTKGVFQES